KLRREGEEALKEKCLRAAVVILEPVLQAENDPEVRDRYDSARKSLASYDDNRRRAAELSRDPANLEDALTSLQAAAIAWDTPQVRQDIDDCSVALQLRRDRIAVADFQAPPEVGIPDVGKSVAEMLLPEFKGKFELLDRDRLIRAADE